MISSDKRIITNAIVYDNLRKANNNNKIQLSLKYIKNTALLFMT
jgi:hypothetical protein